MADQFVFHIRNAPPGDLGAVLATLETAPGLSTIPEIVERAEELGFAIRDRQRLEALATARDLGLVQEGQHVLTETGHILTELELSKPDLFVNIIHGLLYTLWDSDRAGQKCFSWSYRTLCQMLWQSGSVDLASRRDLASEIEARAGSAFARSKIALSPKSVGGALLWLSGLIPPVLNEDGTRFSRRAFCPPELFVMAVDFVYRTQGIDYGANLLLSNEHKEAICQVCLLEPERFDRVLDYAVAQFDYLHKGIGGGWGQYLALDRAPDMKELI